MRKLDTKDSALDTLDLLERRAYYLLGSHLREKDRITDAVRLQDTIRKNHHGTEEWDSVTEIRRWRQAR